MTKKKMFRFTVRVPCHVPWNCTPYPKNPVRRAPGTFLGAFLGQSNARKDLPMQTNPVKQFLESELQRLDKDLEEKKLKIHQYTESLNGVNYWLETLSSQREWVLKQLDTIAKEKPPVAAPKKQNA